MSEQTSEPERIVRDCFDWLNGDSSKVNAISESVDVYGPALPKGEVHTRDEWEAFIRENRNGFPDIHFSIEELVASDDVVMVELRITGTHEGEFMGIPPTGRSVEIPAADKFVVADGKVQEWRTYFDTQEIPEQLGLTFPTVVGQLPKLAWRKFRASV